MNEEIIKCGAFEENPGETSMMRILCFISWWVGLGFSIVAVWLASKELALAAQYSMIFAFGFIGSSIGGKFFQKLVEMNPDMLKKNQV